MTSLAACANQRVKTIPVGPPQELIQDCPATDVPLSDNASLVLALRAARLDLILCNIDKAKLRQWKQEVKAE